MSAMMTENKNVDVGAGCGVDLSTMDQNYPSLCIPRVFSNITRERVFNCFKDLRIGFIDRIDMVQRTAENGDHFQRVFVHLRWNRSEQANKARARILAGGTIKIVYDDPWFWKVSANRTVKRERRPDSKRPGRKQATINFEDMDDDVVGESLLQRKAERGDSGGLGQGQGQRQKGEASAVRPRMLGDFVRQGGRADVRESQRDRKAKASACIETCDPVDDIPDFHEDNYHLDFAPSPQEDDDDSEIDEHTGRPKKMSDYILVGKPKQKRVAAAGSSAKPKLVIKVEESEAGEVKTVENLPV